MKGLFLLPLKLLAEGTWLVCFPLSRCPANRQQQWGDLWWQAWLISDPLFTLSLVRVSPYVQKRSACGWRLQRVQAAPGFEDSRIKRGREGQPVGQWSGEKGPQRGPSLQSRVKLWLCVSPYEARVPPGLGLGCGPFLPERQEWQRGSQVPCHRVLQG